MNPKSNNYEALNKLYAIPIYFEILNVPMAHYEIAVGISFMVGVKQNVMTHFISTDEV